MNMPNILQERDNFKPFEYPVYNDFKNAIQHSYWLVDEFNFDSDIQDFKVKLNDSEREVIKRCMLAISQIEVSVKEFYSVTVSQRFPKPEIKAMAISFGESEVRHEDAYSKLLELLGFNEEFEKLSEIPALIDRVKYLKKYKQWENSRDIKNFIKALILFSIYIEGCSLMSQFLIMLSFCNKDKSMAKIANVVEATSKEENLHSLGAFTLVNDLRREMPEIFDDELNELVNKQTVKALKAETKVLDWIFENGELEFLPKTDVVEFIKNRFNKCLTSMKFETQFEIDQTIQEKTEWFEVMIKSDKMNDFFDTKSTGYSKGKKSFEEDDLF